jgi:alkylation response protein AidB-like acyl-CoA dehydrogenase
VPPLKEKGVDHSVDLIEFRARCEDYFAERYELLDPERHDLPGLIAHTEVDHDAPMRDARAHQSALWEAGLAGLSIERRFGGQGLDADADTVFDDVARRFATPSMVPLSVGLSLALPTLLRFGSDEMCTVRVPRILDASEVWCQLFSEPEAGSDLASLRTTATRTDGGYTIEGQKVWTSFAQHSAYGLLLARTGPLEDRHRGLSLFALEMDIPGVTVRPLREITGGTHFNEVFLDQVALPATSLLGDDGGGWAAAMFTLGNERNLGAQRARPRWKRLHELAAGGSALDAVTRDRLARLAIAEQIRRVSSLSGPASKLAGSQIEVTASQLAVDVLGSRAIAHDDSDTDATTSVHWFLGARANRIAGGTDEIQRNIISERILGLPR